MLSAGKGIVEKVAGNGKISLTVRERMSIIS